MGVYHTHRGWLGLRGIADEDDAVISYAYISDSRRGARPVNQLSSGDQQIEALFRWLLEQTGTRCTPRGRGVKKLTRAASIHSFA
ncbi:MAG: hypothetical protein DMG61_12805 [Acidobacteria bacterium]|nr:MAG: hypothetical protein DMG61_12805 [Acidobacteriota bacterium]